MITMLLRRISGLFLVGILAILPVVAGSLTVVFEDGRKLSVSRAELQDGIAWLTLDDEDRIAVPASRITNWAEIENYVPEEPVLVSPDAWRTAAGELADFVASAAERHRVDPVLLTAMAKARSALDLLSFVYRDPGVFGDDRAYLIRRGVVKATFPFPTTPIEKEAFQAVVEEELATQPPQSMTLPRDSVDEIMLLMSWFRRHPEALRRTTAMEDWAPGSAGPSPN